MKRGADRQSSSRESSASRGRARGTVQHPYDVLRASMANAASLSTSAPASVPQSPATTPRKLVIPTTKPATTAPSAPVPHPRSAEAGNESAGSIEGELWCVWHAGTISAEESTAARLAADAGNPHESRGQAAPVFPTEPQWVVCEHGRRLSVYSTWSSSTRRLVEEVSFDHVRIITRYAQALSHPRLAVGPRAHCWTGTVAPQLSFDARHPHKDGLASHLYYLCVELSYQATEPRAQPYYFSVCTDSVKDYRKWLEYWMKLAQPPSGAHAIVLPRLSLAALQEAAGAAAGGESGTTPHVPPHTAASGTLASHRADEDDDDPLKKKSSPTMTSSSASTTSSLQASMLAQTQAPKIHGADDYFHCATPQGSGTLIRVSSDGAVAGVQHMPAHVLLLRSMETLEAELRAGLEMQELATRSLLDCTSQLTEVVLHSVHPPPSAAASAAIYRFAKTFGRPSTAGSKRDATRGRSRSPHGGHAPSGAAGNTLEVGTAELRTIQKQIDVLCEELKSMQATVAQHGHHAVAAAAKTDKGGARLSAPTSPTAPPDLASTVVRRLSDFGPVAEDAGVEMARRALASWSEQVASDGARPRDARDLLEADHLLVQRLIYGVCGRPLTAMEGDSGSSASASLRDAPDRFHSATTRPRRPSGDESTDGAAAAPASGYPSALTVPMREFSAEHLRCVVGSFSSMPSSSTPPPMADAALLPPPLVATGRTQRPSEFPEDFSLSATRHASERAAAAAYVEALVAFTGAHGCFHDPKAPPSEVVAAVTLQVEAQNGEGGSVAMAVPLPPLDPALNAVEQKHHLYNRLHQATMQHRELLHTLRRYESVLADLGSDVVEEDEEDEAMMRAGGLTSPSANASPLTPLSPVYSSTMSEAVVAWQRNADAPRRARAALRRGVATWRKRIGHPRLAALLEQLRQDLEYTPLELHPRQGTSTAEEAERSVTTTPTTASIVGDRARHPSSSRSAPFCSSEDESELSLSSAGGPTSSSAPPAVLDAPGSVAEVVHALAYERNAAMDQKQELLAGLSSLLMAAEAVVAAPSSSPDVWAARQRPMHVKLERLRRDERDALRSKRRIQREAAERRRAHHRSEKSLEGKWARVRSMELLLPHSSSSTKENRDWGRRVARHADDLRDAADDLRTRYEAHQRQMAEEMQAVIDEEEEIHARGQALLPAQEAMLPRLRECLHQLCNHERHMANTLVAATLPCHMPDRILRRLCSFPAPFDFMAATTSYAVVPALPEAQHAALEALVASFAARQQAEDESMTEMARLHDELKAATDASSSSAVATPVGGAAADDGHPPSSSSSSSSVAAAIADLLAQRAASKQRCVAVLEQLHQATTTSEYERTLDGTEWKLVLSRDEAALDEAARLDLAEVCAPYAVQQQHVRILSKLLGGLQLRFSITHRCGDCSDVAEAVRSCPFPRVQQLYAGRHELSSPLPSTAQMAALVGGDAAASATTTTTTTTTIAAATDAPANTAPALYEDLRREIDVYQGLEQSLGEVFADLRRTLLSDRAQSHYMLADTQQQLVEAREALDHARHELDAAKLELFQGQAELQVQQAERSRFRDTLANALHGTDPQGNAATTTASAEDAAPPPTTTLTEADIVAQLQSLCQCHLSTDLHLQRTRRGLQQMASTLQRDALMAAASPDAPVDGAHLACHALMNANAAMWDACKSQVESDRAELGRLLETLHAMITPLEAASPTPAKRSDEPAHLHGRPSAVLRGLLHRLGRALLGRATSSHHGDGGEVEDGEHASMGQPPSSSSVPWEAVQCCVQPLLHLLDHALPPPTLS